MARTFPHINDTSYPSTDSVNVYKYENDFDYSRWNADVRITLCNVLWNADYHDVVKFESNEERDAWFDNLNGRSVKLTSAFHCVRQDSIKVPLPYDVAQLYNYMIVDAPMQTSEDAPLDYENPNGIRRWYYFVDTAEYKAPSATQMSIRLDEWTTFINDVDIPYMTLERGHAPMLETDVDDYLANPRSNNRYLLAPDFDFGDGNERVGGGEFLPVGNGTKYVMISSTMSNATLANLGMASSMSDSTSPATFSDTSDRWGNKYQVNNYKWSHGNRDFSNAENPTDTWLNNDSTIPTGTDVFCVLATNAQKLFENIASGMPQFAQSILAVFMVDDKMIEIGSNFTFCGVECHRVKPARNNLLKTLNLNKSMFGYPERYSNITKLYTAPYSCIEVTDNDGTTKTFSVEDCGSVEMRQNMSLAYPFVRLETYLTGIGSDEVASYKWQRLDGKLVDKSIPMGDFSKYLFAWDVPTYGLYVNAASAYAAKSYAEIESRRNTAINAYHNAARLANTDRENSNDSADNTVTMVNNSAATEHDNEYAAASTQSSNATRSANTGQTNSNNDAATERDNANRTAAANNTNANNDAGLITTNAALDVALADSLTSESNALSTNNTSLNNLLISRQAAQDNSLTNAMTDSDNAAAAATAATSAVTGIAGAVGNGLASGNPLGMIGSIIGGAAQAANSGVTTAVVIAKNSEQAGLGISTNSQKSSNTQSNNQATNSAQVVTNNNNNGSTNSRNTSVASNNASNVRTNAANTKSAVNSNSSATYDTNVGNAARTRDTDVSNAGATESTQKANADRTKGTTNSNANLERNLTKANSTYTRDSLILNAQGSLDAERVAANAEYQMHRLDAPARHGEYSGDMTLDAFERRGIQVRIRTQRDGEISQAGDLMLRYGYALNQMWDVRKSGFNVMRHFTFWKASDVWVSDCDMFAGHVKSTIRGILMNGVTVWKNPTEIGSVSLYDN